MFYAVGLITGIIIGYFLNNFIRMLRKGIQLKVFGIKISIESNKNKNPSIIEGKKMTKFKI